MSDFWTGVIALPLGVLALAVALGVLLVVWALLWDLRLKETRGAGLVPLQRPKKSGRWGSRSERIADAVTAPKAWVFTLLPRTRIILAVGRGPEDEYQAVRSAIHEAWMDAREVSAAALFGEED